MVRSLRGQLRRSLWDVVPRDHWQSDDAFRRRRMVSIATIVVGAAVLGLSLRVEQGSGWFYVGTFALAGVWATGAFVSGPLHLGRIQLADRAVRPVVQPVVIGLGLALLFCGGALVVREVPFLADQVRNVTGYAVEGALPVLVVVTVLNGIAEELFFRGALYAAARRHQVAVTTLVYAAATAATGNVMLSFAAAVLGVVVALERRASGGILGPVLTHLTWSLTMLLALPAIL